MEIKPILFSTEMVKAILENRKTQTRRINPDGSVITKPIMELYDSQSRTYGIETYQDKHYTEKVCCVEAPVPVCPGDILWVRETWTSEAGRYYYRADFESDFLDPCETLSGGYPGSCIRKDCNFCQAQPERICWRPSIHMPKKAARLFLHICGCRTERLNVITMEDIIAEGIIFKMKEPLCWNHMTNLALGRIAFSEVWDKTIREDKIPIHGWKANPWVWVYSFERIEKPKDWPNI